jgi:hypothetical protein
MSKKEKAIQRLLGKPKDYTYSELVTLLSYFSYKEDNGGKTSGSAVRFFNSKTKHIIRVHKPHPNPEMNSIAIKHVINDLRKEGYLK